LLNSGYTYRLWSLGALLDAELDPLVFLERLVAVALDLREVDEHVCCAVIGSDKAEALVAVEPFHSSLRHTFLLLSFFTGCQRTSLLTVSRVAVNAYSIAAARFSSTYGRRGA